MKKIKKLSFEKKQWKEDKKILEKDVKNLQAEVKKVIKNNLYIFDVAQSRKLELRLVQSNFVFLSNENTKLEQKIIELER